MNPFTQYFPRKNKIYYTPCTGITCLDVSLKIITYNDYIHACAKSFFNILNRKELDYYVFAGTSIGYLRNKRNIPWVDDYDIILFEKDIYKLENEILPLLIQNGFKYRKWLTDEGQEVGYLIFSEGIETNNASHGFYRKSFFQCDIFFTTVDNKNMIRNVAGRGLYTKKDIPYDYVFPPQKLMMEGIELPFFNKIEKDVEQEYGDIYKTCCVHIGHQGGKKIYKPFNLAYKDFEVFIDVGKQNTLNYISPNKNYRYENNIMLNDDVKSKNVFEMLRYINNNNVKKIYIMNERFLKFVISIKYFFPKIEIVFYMMEEINKFNTVFLNYVPEIFISNESLLKIYEHENLFFFNKPKFTLINVITFGTYDLFHVGHFNILKKAKKIGSKLIVGVSSDELNSKKGKSSINNTEKRISDINDTEFADEIFIEESLEDKDEYIKKYNCNLLVMGDDWLNKFNWVSCPCIYFPRTPNISTTMLKEQMKEHKDDTLDIKTVLNEDNIEDNITASKCEYECDNQMEIHESGKTYRQILSLINSNSLEQEIKEKKEQDKKVKKITESIQTISVEFKAPKFKPINNTKLIKSHAFKSCNIKSIKECLKENKK